MESTLTFLSENSGFSLFIIILLLAIVIVIGIKLYSKDKEKEAALNAEKENSKNALKNLEKKLKEENEVKLDEVNKLHQKIIDELHLNNKEDLDLLKKELKELKEKIKETPINNKDLIIKIIDFTLSKIDDVKLDEFKIFLKSVYEINVKSSDNLKKIYESLKNHLSKICEIEDKEIQRLAAYTTIKQYIENPKELSSISEIFEISELENKNLESTKAVTEGQNEENPSIDDTSADNNQETGIEDTGSSDDSNEENNTKTEVSDNESDNTSGVGKDKE